MRKWVSNIGVIRRSGGHMRKFASFILALDEESGMKSSEIKYSHKICGQELVSYAAGSAVEAGADITAVLSYQNGDRIKEILPGYTVLQTGKPGIWDSIWQEKQLLDDLSGTLLVFPADYPAISGDTLDAAFKYHIENKNQVTVLTNRKGDLSNICFFDVDSLKTILGTIKSQDEDKVILLSDIFRTVQESGQKLSGYSLSDDEELLKVDDRISLDEAERIIHKRIIKKHMENGVTFHLPETSYIHVKVLIGRDSVIMPGTILEGNTVIGERSVIGPYSRIEDGIVGNDVSFMNSVMTQSQIGDNTKVGPFAYIRPGSKIGSNIKIGDFVEIKNSVIGDKSKVPHLSYIGDADIGKGVNIGCGAIVVNYDGKEKHRTVVGDHAFVGCNVNLVSPVVVKDNAYIAAGSTITEEVPEYALAIARSRQTIINDWVKRKGLDKK